MPGFPRPSSPAPWHTTPLLCASDLVWKTFLRKYCQVQKTQTLLSRIFLWTKETGLTYSGLQVQPALLFKRRHAAVLTRTKGLRHCAQCGLGRAGRARQEEERSKEQHWHWERRETRGKTQSLVEQVLYLLCSFCMLPVKTPKYHVPTFKVHMPSFWGLLLRKKVYKGLFLFAAGMKSKIHNDSLQNGRKLDVCLRNLDTLILKRNYHTGQKYVWNTKRLWKVQNIYLFILSHEEKHEEIQLNVHKSWENSLARVITKAKRSGRKNSWTSCRQLVHSLSACQDELVCYVGCLYLFQKWCYQTDGPVSWSS